MSTFFLSPVLPLFHFPLSIRCCSRALPRYPVDYFIGEIQLTNYAFSYDMICHNLEPLLVFLFFIGFLLFLLFRLVRRRCWVGLGWKLGHGKWRRKPHKFVYGSWIF
jgi:hypothetical protein